MCIVIFFRRKRNKFHQINNNYKKRKYCIFINAVVESCTESQFTGLCNPFLPDIRPMATEQVCVQFNDLRNDILLLLELKAACDACEFELQSLKLVLYTLY